MEIELQYYEVYTLSRIIKNIYPGLTNKKIDTLIKVPNIDSSQDLMFGKGTLQVHISSKALVDLREWGIRLENYHKFLGLDPEEYILLSSKELDALLMVKLIKKITIGAKKWKVLNTTIRQLFLIYQLRSCEEFLLFSSDSKHRIIQKIIFLSKSNCYFPVSLLMPFTLKGKSFAPIENLCYINSEQIERNRLSKEVLVNILNKLPEKSRQDLKSTYTFLQGVV